VNVEEIKKIAKELYTAIVKTGNSCKLVDASAEDCGDTIAITYEFRGCKFLAVNEDEAEQVVNKYSKYVLYAIEVGKDKIKVVLKTKKACELSRINIADEELELPKIENEEQLKEVLNRFSELVVIVGKKGCEVYEKVFPDILSSAIARAVDLLPIFIVEIDDINDKKFKRFLDEFKVVVCPTVIRIKDKKEIKRMEGIVGDSEEEIKQTIKLLRDIIER